MNTMIRSIGSMTRWPWNTGTTAAVLLPSGYGVAMKFLPLRSGPGLRTKQIVWTVEEIFDILVQHDRYSTGTFQVNANWDEDTIALGSLALTGPTLPLSNVSDVSTIIEPDHSESKTLPFNHTSDERISNTELSAVQQNSYLEANEEDVQLQLKYLQGGAVYHDVQIYNATLKALMQIVANTGSIWPMVATYNDMDDFTLSVRSISVKKGRELTSDEAGQILSWFPMSTESWGEQAGVITVGGRARGILCVDRGDRTGFLTSVRCNPDLDVYEETAQP